MRLIDTHRWLALLAPLALYACIPGLRSIPPTALEAGGIRDLGEGPFMLDFLTIKGGTEDRVALELDTRNLSTRRPFSVQLPLNNFDEGGEAGMIDVYVYEGDGQVEPEDFGAGHLLTRLPAPKDGTYTLDLSQALQDVSTRYLGIRLSTRTADRYFLGEPVGLQPPTLAYGSKRES